MKKNQSGFTILEITLSIIVTAIIAGAVGYVISQHNKTNTQPAAKTSDLSLDSAVKQTQTVYDANNTRIDSAGKPIASDWGKQNLWAYGDLQFINGHKSWFAQNFIDSANNIEATNQTPDFSAFLECENAMFSSFTVKGVSLNDQIAKVNVTENGQGSETFGVQLQNNSNNWVVESVDLSNCPH